MTRRDPPRSDPDERVGDDTGSRRSRPEIHERVLETAESELRRPAFALLSSALEAGLTIGFSFVGAAYAASLVDGPNRAAAAAAAAAAYPLGFILVVLARSQLFTENTLEPVVPLLANRDAATLRRVLRLWGIVLAGNLAGALLFALVAARTPTLAAELHPSLLQVARDSTDGGFLLVAWRAVFGGWLVALMALLLESTRSTGAQIALVWLTTAPIAAFGFRHSIVGGVEAFYRAWMGDAGWGAMLGEFLVPALIGNVAGGVTLVALLTHAQTAQERRRG